MALQLGKSERGESRNELYIEEAGTTLASLVEAVLAEEILLGVAGDLGGRPGADELLGDASPIPLPELLQPHQERPVLLLRPRHA